MLRNKVNLRWKKLEAIFDGIKAQTQSGSFGHVKTRAKKNLGKGKIGKKRCVSGKESLLRFHHDKERMMKQMFLQINKENLHLLFQSAFLSQKMPSGKDSLPRLHHDKEKMLEEIVQQIWTKETFISSFKVHFFFKRW